MPRSIYVATAAGQVKITRDGREQAGLWLFDDIPLPQRKALRAKLDADVVRAAWLVYGTRCVPAHVNEMQRWLVQLKAVLRSSPRLWPIVHRGLRDFLIPPSPAETIVQRVRQILSGAGIDVHAVWTQTATTTRVRDVERVRHQLSHPTVRFWAQNSGPEDEPLNASGWWFLEHRLTRPSDEHGGYRIAAFAAYNALGAARVRQCPDAFVDLLMSIQSEGEGTANRLIRAFLKASPSSAVSEQSEVLLRWFWHRLSGGLTDMLRAGVPWPSLVEHARRDAIERLKTVDPEGELFARKWIGVFGTRVNGRFFGACRIGEDVTPDRLGMKVANACRQHSLEDFRQAAVTSVLVENEDVLTRDFLQAHCPKRAQLYETAVEKKGLRGRLFHTGLFDAHMQIAVDDWPRPNKICWPNVERFCLQSGGHTAWAYIVDADEARVEVYVGARTLDRLGHYVSLPSRQDREARPAALLTSVAFAELNQVSVSGVKRWLASLVARCDELNMRAVEQGLAAVGR